MLQGSCGQIKELLFRIYVGLTKLHTGMGYSVMFSYRNIL